MSSNLIDVFWPIMNECRTGDAYMCDRCGRFYKRWLSFFDHYRVKHREILEPPQS